MTVTTEVSCFSIVLCSTCVLHAGCSVSRTGECCRYTVITDVVHRDDLQGPVDSHDPQGGASSTTAPPAASRATLLLTRSRRYLFH